MVRQANFERKTLETHIRGYLNIDGTGENNIDTGIGFLDHMLRLFSFHSGFDLELTCRGDLEVCPHHSIEDSAIVLGEAFAEALQDKHGIARHAVCYLPMDESLTRTALDISGRPFHVFQGELKIETIGNFPTEMTSHFFYSFAMNSRITLHQKILYGENAHHQIESLFKGLASALDKAITIKHNKVPSSKGTLI